MLKTFKNVFRKKLREAQTEVISLNPNYPIEFWEDLEKMKKFLKAHYAYRTLSERNYYDIYMVLLKDYAKEVLKIIEQIANTFTSGQAKVVGSRITSSYVVKIRNIIYELERAKDILASITAGMNAAGNTPRSFKSEYDKFCNTIETIDKNIPSHNEILNAVLLKHPFKILKYSVARGTVIIDTFPPPSAHTLKKGDITAEFRKSEVEDVYTHKWLGHYSTCEKAHKDTIDTLNEMNHFYEEKIGASWAALEYVFSSVSRLEFENAAEYLEEFLYSISGNNRNAVNKDIKTRLIPLNKELIKKLKEKNIPIASIKTRHFLQNIDTDDIMTSIKDYINELYK